MISTMHATLVEDLAVEESHDRLGTVVAALLVLAGLGIAALRFVDRKSVV